MMLSEDKVRLLRALGLGSQVAEDEIGELAAYFVETDQWRRTYSGDIDVVYGPKGSGKSAIYSLLLNRKSELRARNIVAVAAEQVRGAPAFRDLVIDPPASEREFVGLWKLYLLSLVGVLLREEQVRGESAETVTRELERIGLLEKDTTLAARLRRALDYVRRVEGEVGVEADPSTGAPNVTGRIRFREPSQAGQELGLVSVDTLLSRANDALQSKGLYVWLLLDRLDVAFEDSTDLERNALAALFRVYLDLLAYTQIRLKIFLRTDIWKRVTEGGFREASHIQRTTTISWDSTSLMNLMIRRLLINPEIAAAYGVQPDDILRSSDRQRELFLRVFPGTVGKQESQTFSWMLWQTSDGSGMSAPREVIHLLKEARDIEIQQLDIGLDSPPLETLFDERALRRAAQRVSKVKLEQTLLAEYPEFREYIARLEGKSNLFSVEQLAQIWGRGGGETRTLVARLIDVGFFMRRKGGSVVIPPVYATALRLVPVRGPTLTRTLSDAASAVNAPPRATTTEEPVSLEVVSSGETGGAAEPAAEQNAFIPLGSVINIRCKSCGEQFSWKVVGPVAPVRCKACKKKKLLGSGAVDGRQEGTTPP